MKIKVLYRNDPERGLTDPVLEPGGRKLVFRLVSGDWLDPYWPPFGNSWFNPPFPTGVLHVNVKLPLPFICFKWPFMNRCCYLGWKIYGVDNDVYKTWLTAPENVYDGSQALCLSFRPFASIK